MSDSKRSRSRDSVKVAVKRIAAANKHQLSRFVPEEYGLVAVCKRCKQKFVIRHGTNAAAGVEKPCRPV